MNPRLRRSLDLLRPISRHLPLALKRPLYRLLVGPGRAPPPDYASRIAAETAIFADQIEVHDLPPIFHYWSNTWLRPQLEAFGFSNPDEFFGQSLLAACADAAAAGRSARLASIGCGNCDTEVRAAQYLVAQGVHDFVIDCVDINADMLARGRDLASEAGVDRHIIAAQADFNHWQPPHRYDAVLANQSLHHVVELEHLFGAIDSALHPDGRLITSDMIGRNGHMRWPEALALVQDYWRELPRSYRRNRQLQRYERRYKNWDCSVEGFEGIRAQDILPLLLERFEFEVFIGYGNLIDPFIDRSFGPNFDADSAWDRAFIDRVHARDEAEMLSGRITPTHMLAVLRKRPWDGLRRYRPGLTPEHCLRPPARSTA